MIDVGVLKFCECNAVSIERFLSDNFAFVRLKQKGCKRHRIKHNEISKWPNIILVPLPFAHRYKELVLRGKLVIVIDEFGKYAVYINPRIISETLEIAKLKMNIESFDLIPDEYLEDECLENKRKQIIDKIADVEENLRLIRHFKGEESLSYMKGVTGAIGTVKEINRARKKVEK